VEVGIVKKGSGGRKEEDGRDRIESGWRKESGSGERI